MTVAALDYQAIRRAGLQLPPKQRLQLIKEAILTLTADELSLTTEFDFEATVNELQQAFATTQGLTAETANEARHSYLLEKHGA
jgi:hypothetical protein